MTFDEMYDIQYEYELDEAVETLLDVYRQVDRCRYQGDVSWTGRHVNDEFCEMLTEYLGEIRNSRYYDFDWRLASLKDLLDKTQQNYPSVIDDFFD